MHGSALASFPGSSAPERKIELVHACTFRVPESLGTRLVAHDVTTNEPRSQAVPASSPANTSCKMVNKTVYMSLTMVNVEITEMKISSGFQVEYWNLLGSIIKPILSDTIVLLDCHR